jgi:uncharacterized membrane protein YkoI
MRKFYVFATFLILLSLPLLAATPQTERSHTISKGELALSKQVKITFEEAKKIATTKVPGKIFNWELEKEGGQIIYTFEIQLPDDSKYSREVNVDAMTGKIVAVEKEDLKKQFELARKPS